MRPIAMIAAVAIATAVATTPAGSKSALPFASILGNASDNALDKLAQPNGFYNDAAVRIGLPGPLQKASGLLKLTDKLGVTQNLTKSLNDAASAAAGEAKPIFRTAINNLSLTDVPGIATKSDGATQYLKKSAGTELRGKIRPLIVGALGRTGAFGHVDKIAKSSSLLGQAGISRDTVSDSVTDQALTGIYKYMGAEEGKVRKNPLKLLKL